MVILKTSRTHLQQPTFNSHREPMGYPPSALLSKSPNCSGRLTGVGICRGRLLYSSNTHKGLQMLPLSFGHVIQVALLLINGILSPVWLTISIFWVGTSRLRNFFSLCRQRHIITAIRTCLSRTRVHAASRLSFVRPTQGILDQTKTRRIAFSPMLERRPTLGPAHLLTSSKKLSRAISEPPPKSIFL